ncbi:EAL domain-containing protein [Methylobacter tundripaludum]|uniref:Response regulator receiver modulated diguanylate cyclase/phosphodiesterase with PAS/PAC sensor(S) n=1 Tax=Methylobacter tundripaludum (strain ATCC BAA-1195 / DSM 17260 / SV96) TaxID=697282 RepID=G3IVE1_METTV|nr:EAL domain-containing protein [Methylobacter tundripaludum]EGW22868.1 response regulator receiver modulated diguanylate cyclase/phosphodiesterase with PAS/PAC sensor(s) [Methylobacter tundripaludum SV96]
MNSATATADMPTILIVDDTPVNLGVVVESLENRGYRLLIAQDGTEGLKRAAFVKPDLILLDVLMPGLDGFEVCRRLKGDADTADIPVIFMTALGDSDHKITGFKVGGVDYLSKPMQIDEVIARVGAHLNLRAMQRQLQLQNEQLQRHQEELEQKVAQRTAELSIGNRLLREEIEERKRVENMLKFIAQRGWMEGGETFLTSLSRYLGRLLEVDYVIIDKLSAEPSHAETVAIYAKGEVLPNLRYSLEHTPCENVMAGGLCCYPGDVQQQFPEDTLLADMQVESYIGLPLCDSTGKVIGLIAVMDGKPMCNELAVTSMLQLVATSAAAELERRQSEQAIFESRQFLVRVIDAIADPVFVKDREHRWLLLNQACCELIGHSRAELLGKSDSDYFPEHEARALQEGDDAVFDSGLENGSENEITDGQGVKRTISTTKSCFLDNNGQPVLVGIIRDITERKQYELNLLKRAQLEEQLSCLADSVPGFIYTIRLSLDGHASFPFASAGIEALFGLSPEDIRDDAEVLRARYHPEDLPRVIAQLEKSGRKLSPYRIEIRILHPHKGLRWIEIRSTPQRQPDGSTEWHGLMIDITERKASDEQLALLDYALDHVGEAVYLTDEDSRILQVNEEASRMLGYTRAELLEMRIVDIDLDLGPERWRQHWGELISGMSTITLETRHQTKEGGIILLEVNANPIVYQGRYYNFALVRDITERKQMETELRQRELEFRVLVENSPDPIFRYDRDCRRIYANPAVEKLVGCPASQLINRMPSDASVVSAYEGEKLVQAIRQVLETGLTAESEVEFIADDGQRHYFHNRYAPEFGPQGEVAGVISIARDITERKQAENLRHQRERELRTLVENLPTMVVRYDRNFQRIYVNPAYSQIIGRTEAEMFGSPLKKSWRATNISAESYQAILSGVMRSGKKAEVSLEWTDGDGRLISHVMKIVPECDADGKIDSVLALGFDLSDRRQQQVVEANRQRVFEKMAHGDNINGILEQVALYVESSKSGRYCAILLLDEEQKHLQTVAAPSFPASYKAKLNPQMLDEESGNCHGWVASALSGERIIVADMTKHPCWSLCQSFIREIGAVACWSEPIFSSSNQLLGVVTLYLNQSGVPDEADLSLLLQAGHLSSIAIERKRIEQQMYRQASYDQLTGLPNRRLFGNRLREEIVKAERGAYSLAVLFIDLDRFKEVNDTLGHDAGDDLLVEAAQRIRLCVRESDTVARLGGDEFVVILPKVDEIVPQDRVAQCIVDAMVRPFLLGEQNAYVSASIGIAGYPQDADNAEVLIGCADQAMYVAKSMGRNCFSFFTHGMLEQARHRLELVNDLRGALDAGQLEVYYQPIIEVVSGKAVKAEALLRWHHPELGMVPPDRFIPIAEETDLIQEIGAWVFREAADTAKRWHGLSEEDGVGQISVNMSPRQFTKDSGVQTFIDYLQEAAIDPSYLVVEITEGLLLDDCSAVTEKLELLRAAGIQLSLDDFGTGYSAMAYLKKFNIDYLKIDRSFVRDLETDPGDRAIAEAIVVMAHRLGLKVIAEGVETEGQRALLMAVGCEYVQGYLYAKPMPVEAFLAYVAG